MSLLTVQSSPASYNFLPLRSEFAVQIHQPVYYIRYILVICEWNFCTGQPSDQNVIEWNHFVSLPQWVNKPCKYILGALFLGVKCMKLTIHLHLLLRSNNVWYYTSTPPIRLHGVVLS